MFGLRKAVDSIGSDCTECERLILVALHGLVMKEWVAF